MEDWQINHFGQSCVKNHILSHKLMLSKVKVDGGKTVNESSLHSDIETDGEGKTSLPVDHAAQTGKRSRLWG